MKIITIIINLLPHLILTILVFKVIKLETKINNLQNCSRSTDFKIVELHSKIDETACRKHKGF